MKNLSNIHVVKKIALSIALATSMSGCAVYKDKQQIDQYSASAQSGVDGQVLAVVDNAKIEAKRAAQIVNKPYLVGKARPIARDAVLPLVLQGKIDTTLLYADEADLSTIASRITDATGIPVKVTPDALMPQEAFQPRLEPAKNSTLANGTAAPSTASMSPPSLDSLLPMDFTARDNGPLGTSPLTKPGFEVNRLQRGKQYLPQVLDAISLRLGVYWKYDDQIGAIVLFRTETRTFEIRGADLSASVKMSVGIDGSVDGQSNSNGFDTTSMSSLDMKGDKDGPMASVLSRIGQFMTVSGKLSSGSGGLIVVTDTKSALDQIATFVSDENRMRSRRIDLVFEEITVENTNSSQAGVNHNLLFNSGGKGNGFDLNGLNSLIDQEGAALSVGASIGSGPWKGSSIAVQALAKFGKVVDKKVNAFSSLNNQPATTGKPERQKYIDKMEQTPGYADNSEPTVTVTQGEVISGRIITLVPHAYADGSIDIALKYDNTPSPELIKQSFTQGGYVQSPKSNSDTLVVTTSLKTGQPYVVNAFTAQTDSYDARRVDPNAPIALGGSDVTNRNNRVTVLVLTARVHE
jgi:type IVB pilus formation R64 PilN family outer membrane protein